jgi:hypothetical protein
MSFAWLYTILKDFQTMLGIVVSTTVTLVIFAFNRRRDRFAGDQATALAWRAVLIESSMALTRMAETSRILLLGKFHHSDILLLQGIRERFLASAPSHRSAELVLSIHENLHLFIWNMGKAQDFKAREMAASDGLSRDRLAKSFASHRISAIGFFCNRHHLIVDWWNECYELFLQYCADKGVSKGDILVPPSKAPKAWQRDEKVDWKLEELPTPELRGWGEATAET